MPGLVRKFLIYASVNGLVLQAHGPTEHHKVLHIDYGTSKIRSSTQEESQRHKSGAHLEAHGIIGLLSIASFNFLIAITRREQVAQVFGKPVYVITDVALLPLSNQDEVSKAIDAAAQSRRADDDISDSDLSDGEGDESKIPEADIDNSPVDEPRPLPPQSHRTSVAEDVIARKGQYGRFASQWFTKQGWTPARTGIPSQLNQSNKDATELVSYPAVKDVVTSNLDDQSATKSAFEKGLKPSSEGDADILPILPKILRATRLILSSRSFFFSYEFDLTRRLALTNGTPQLPSMGNRDSLYVWNRRLGSGFVEAGQDAFVMPIVQGFVGQRSFSVKKPAAESKEPTSTIALGDNGETDNIAHAVEDAKQALTKDEEMSQPFLITLISRRSVKRSGLRYLRRGVDDEGNCANSVETEQILSAPDWNRTDRLRSFVQIRGSIPLYFSQSPYSLKPTPILHQSQNTNEAAMKKHFQSLKTQYGNVQAALLVDKHGGEKTIGDAYEKTVKTLSDSGELTGVSLEWFDFHGECRGMKFENVDRLINKLQNNITTFGETVIVNGVVEKRQSGIIRTNCMDCLDRTNVAQSAFGQYFLQKDLIEEGYVIDLLHDEGTTWFNTLWADNGDAISRQYASTAALKGDFVRTRRRDYRGALNDFSLTLTRYYNNMVNDYLSQSVIDVLLGNVSWKVFADFEATMMSVDPGVSIERIRETAIETSSKVVIQDKDEDLIHGWTMLVPAQNNTLRALPFEEAVILLTDTALYCCRFDWTTEKVASFEKVPLLSISKIRYGTYVTSTLSERQMNEELNAGLVIVYTPGKDSMIRTNTRSLSNAAPLPPANKRDSGIDGGTGIMSWLGSRSTQTSRTLALKIIPGNIDAVDYETKPSDLPLAISERISEEIRNTIVGPVDTKSSENGGLIEKGDIISLDEAKKRTGYLEQLGYSIKKLVWT